jgi:RNA polymerase sigma factor (sigma-70 family)
MTPLFAAKQQAAGEKAFERLYRAHVNDVYRYALMVLRNPADAEDVAQTTFMNAYRAMERGEQPRSPRHWLIAIAHNVCRSRLRDAGRRPQQVELEEYHVATPESDGNSGVDPQELVHALGALSFNQRSALVMRELEGRSYAEIAEMLEVSPSAVETLLFRARRAVREQLEGTLTCGEAELTLSKQLDGRLDAEEKKRLRAHLRACKECAGLARRERARSAALRGLAFPLPGSLASWGGGTAVGTGLAAKAAAIVAASVAAAGVAHQVAQAVDTPSSREHPKVEHATTPQARPGTFFSRRSGTADAGAAGKQKATSDDAGSSTRAPTAPTVDRTRALGGASLPAPGALPGVPVPVPVPVPTPPVQLPAPPALPVTPPAVPPVSLPGLPPIPAPAPPPVQVPPPPPVPSTPEVPPIVP